MAFFQSADHLKRFLGGFFEQVVADPEMGPRLVASQLILKFVYTHPDAAITIDFSGERVQFSYDDANKPATVEMSMEAEVAHRYWLGEISLPVALARRQIRAKGPIPKILKLLPIIRKAHQMYPAYMAQWPGSSAATPQG